MVEDEKSLQQGPEEQKNPNSEGAVVPSESRIEPISDPEIENLIALLSRRTQALTQEEYTDSIAKRQEAVNKFLFRGGTETLRRFFERVRQMEAKQPIKLDLSMLEISGRILGGLYLPGANLDKLIFTDCDLTGSNFTGAKLNEVLANGAILRGVVASGADFTNAVIPGSDLSGGRFVGATFVNTVMLDVKVDKDTNFAGARFVGTFLSGVDLSITNTTGAVFRGIRR